MKKGEKIVCALFPNALGVGYAIFENPKKLLYQQLVRIRPMCSRKSKAFIEKLIDELQPDVVILEDPSAKNSRKRERVTKLIQDIVLACNSKDINVYQYSREHIQNVFEQFGKTTKYGIAVSISEWFPKLKSQLPRPWKLGHSEQHHQGMFDAISLGMTHYYLRD